jgi:hypothetical protein
LWPKKENRKPYVESLESNNMKKCWVGTLCCLLLVGCFESEEACRDRLVEDFNSSVEFAKSASCKAELGELECANHAVDAAGSALEIFAIEIDDDQDACDYYSDGALLRRK